MRKDLPINFCREVSVEKRFNLDKLFEFKQLSVRKRFSPDKVGHSLTFVRWRAVFYGRFLILLVDFCRFEAQH